MVIFILLPGQPSTHLQALAINPSGMLCILTSQVHHTADICKTDSAASFQSLLMCHLLDEAFPDHYI